MVVTLDADTCYRALRARDARFDGLFFVAVSTTGIYCRPVCPARTPGRDRCRFFALPAEAEKAGFRACFRCRPELAPGHARVDSVPRLVRSAVARIEAACLNEGSVEELAAGLGVSSRHLRRAMEAELGVGPLELAQTRRLAMAKQLLHDSTLPLTDVAFASGFSSIRRFNAVFRERFGRPPSEVRRSLGAAGRGLSLRLGYRPPFDWAGLLAFLELRAIPGVESVSDGAYRRSVEGGRLEVRDDPERSCLRATLSAGLVRRVMPLATRLRSLFDLDARPRVISGHLGCDPVLRSRVRRRPGLRVPGAFDGFELVVRAVLGQQVSVRGATTLSGRLVQRFGRPVESEAPGITHLFPTPAALAAASEAAVASVGLPRARARTLVALGQAVASKALVLDGSAPVDEVRDRLRAMPGIGPWTVEYVAMRALSSPDAFPASDLGLRLALGRIPAAEVEALSASWRPWRAYAAMHLWASLALET